MDMPHGAAAELVVRGGDLLVPGEGLRPADLICDGGLIVDVVPRATVPGARAIDATGCLVLPGIVDVHGDAFERQIMPRPKTIFPLDIALLETDRQLAANGITTAYHGVTISWEPGLRSIEQSQKLIEALDAIEESLLVDHRLHLRWETFAIDEAPAVVALFMRTKKPALAFNDHTGPSLAGERKPHKLSSSADRAMVDLDTYMSLLEERKSRLDEVAPAIEVMAELARSHSIPLLSHDDTTPEMRTHFRELGAAIAEFPMNWETAEAAAAHGDPIILGAPNVVRGGSHNGAISAEEALRRGQCSILATDYYYPAPLQAALKLAASGALPLEKAWPLISEAPARAMRLDDRGVLTPGKRADFIVLPRGGTRPCATASGGRIVYRES